MPSLREPSRYKGGKPSRERRKIKRSEKKADEALRQLRGEQKIEVAELDALFRNALSPVDFLILRRKIRFSFLPADIKQRFLKAVDEKQEGQK